MIDIAIYEKRIEDVLKWFDIHKKKRGNWTGDDMSDRVASAIVTDYPDKSVGIWKRLAEKHISVTNAASYAEGAQYL